MVSGEKVNRKLMKIGDLKCPNCKNELEEEYQGNFYFSREIDGEILEYDEEISKYYCNNCGAIYQGKFLLTNVEYLKVIEEGKEERPKTKFKFEIY